jgi:hypothetical protein
MEGQVMRQSRDYRLSILLAATCVGAALGSGCVARVGLYDPDHRDYHRWDDREDRAYRQFLAERHEEYRGFQSRSADDQREYWRWRHDHPDGS